jgi:hypothetical protein
MKKLIAFAIILLFAFGCKKDLDLKGTITGKVELSAYMNSDNSPEGVKVVLENDHFRRETLTNDDGIYSFENIDGGYYNLTYSYNGFGTYQMKDYTVIGLGKMNVIKRTTLYKIHDFNFQEAHLSVTGGVNGYAVIEGFVTSAPGMCERLGMHLYFDKTPDVSHIKHIYSTNGSANFKRVEGDTLFIKDFIHDLPKGENWYVGIYIRNESDNNPPTTLKKAYETLKLKVQ